MAHYREWQQSNIKGNKANARPITLQGTL